VGANSGHCPTTCWQCGDWHHCLHGVSPYAGEATVLMDILQWLPSIITLGWDCSGQLHWWPGITSCLASVTQTSPETSSSSHWTLNCFYDIGCCHSGLVTVFYLIICACLKWPGITSPYQFLHYLMTTIQFTETCIKTKFYKSISLHNTDSFLQ